MKKKLFILTIIFSITFFSLQGQDCVECDSNSNANGNYATALGKSTSAIGDYSFASGTGSDAEGIASFSAGTYTTAFGNSSVSLGTWNYSEGIFSITIGSYCKTTANDAIVIGQGISENDYLTNPNSSSLLIGFNSNKPTFYISRSEGSGRTGKIGIGNIPALNPQAKLHIRSDDGEIAALLIEPNNWSAGEYAKLFMGDTSHYIKAENTNGLEFGSQNNFIFSGNNTGFGITEPKAKVHISGDLLFEHSMNGIIMKSEDGNCWKGTISNNGELLFTQIDCGTLISIQNITEPKHSEVFIYPNPTKGEITIEYTGSRKNIRAEFHTINGLLLSTHKITKGENKIELINMPGQVIIASIYTKKGELISTNKVMINR